jgi:23S rRNA pseudouridine2605 synthase
VRLQRALARAGVASRRAAEELIRQGVVEVNGATAVVGQTVDPAEDVITVRGERLKQAETRCIALHKPVGYVVSRSDEKNRPTVFELIPDIPGITYVGRLDFLTSGLLLMMNDGFLVNRLTHPSYGVEKEYRVTTTGVSPAAWMRALEAGVKVEHKRVSVSRFQVDAVGRERVDLTLTVTEGRNRIVRKMCDVVGADVVQLKRTAHGPVRLGNIPEGRWRELTKAELKAMPGPQD